MLGILIYAVYFLKQAREAWKQRWVKGINRINNLNQVGPFGV